MTGTVPNKKYLTLTESLTFLVFGEAWDRDALWRKCRDTSRELGKLFDLCRAEANDDPKYSKFSKRLRYGYASDILRQLEECRQHWPTTVNEAYQRIQELQGAEEWSFTRKIEKAFDEVLSKAAYAGTVVLHGIPAAYADTVRLHGSEQNEIDADLKDIPITYFRTPRIVCWQCDQIIPKVKNASPELKENTWLEVLVEREGFMALVERERGKQPTKDPDASSSRRKPRSHDRSADIELQIKINRVLDRARQLYPDEKKRPSDRQLAKEITQPPDCPFKEEVVRKILAGKYSTMTRLGIPGL